MREMTKSHDKKVAGVAAGMAEYFEMDKTLVRAIWLFGMLVMPPALIAYIVLAVAMPAPAGKYDPIDVQPVVRTDEEQGHREQKAPPRSERKLTRSEDRWIAGVAAGLAEYFDIDPVLVRALFLVGLFVGGGLLLYLILWIVMPRPAYQFR